MLWFDSPTFLSTSPLPLAVLDVCQVCVCAVGMDIDVAGCLLMHVYAVLEAIVILISCAMSFVISGAAC